ncbi:DUF4870 domain-containing protein [Streptosporangium sp. NPDC048865]|uniref:DUF4870 domain-containing protein n=1 Tax=Streptosporangium sp. NPDC048865 TaxID=3155766 RepID=UPI0034363559
MSENPEGPPGDDRTRRIGDPPPGQAHGQDQRYGGYPPYDSPYAAGGHQGGHPGHRPGQPGYGPYGSYGPSWGYGYPPPPGTQGPRPGSDDATMAMLAHLLGLLTSFVGPLVLYLVKKDESPYARDQAAEALNFQLTLLILQFVAWILAFFLIGFLLIFLFWIGSIVMAVVAAVAANRGERYRYPVNIRFVG